MRRYSSIPFSWFPYYQAKGSSFLLQPFYLYSLMSIWLFTKLTTFLGGLKRSTEIRVSHRIFVNIFCLSEVGKLPLRFLHRKSQSRYGMLAQGCLVLVLYRQLQQKNVSRVKPTMICFFQIFNYHLLIGRKLRAVYRLFNFPQG